MRVLLDECVPQRLAEHLAGHDVRTVTGIGWAGVKNGELIKRASSQFDAIITVDYGFGATADLIQTSLRLFILKARSNKYKHIARLVPNLVEMLNKGLPPGRYELRT